MACCPADVVEETSQLCQAFARAALDCFLQARPFDDGELSQRVAEAILAENADASEPARRRCEALRAALAEAVQAEIQEFSGEDASDGDSACWLKVRGSARRRLPLPAFAVGRAAACDVEVYGDASVPAVACVAVVRPNGLFVVDLCRGQRPAATCPFMVRHGDDEVNHAVGIRSTVSFSTKQLPHHEQELAPAEVLETQEVEHVRDRTDLLERLEKAAAAKRKRAPLEERMQDTPASKARRWSDGALSTASTSLASLFSSASSPPARAGSWSPL